jgi:predicted Fe-Mo cluster-binding NifX family protein
MKIGVSSTGNDINADVDPRFGRCKYFLIIDIDTMKFEIIDNENAMTSGGAGIQAAQMIARKGVKTVITGNVGPNAFQTLTAAGIKIFSGASGSVKQVVENFKKGGLKETQQASVNSHFGMGGGGR